MFRANLIIEIMTAALMCRPSSCDQGPFVQWAPTAHKFQSNYINMHYYGITNNTVQILMVGLNIESIGTINTFPNRGGSRG